VRLQLGDAFRYYGRTMLALRLAVLAAALLAGILDVTSARAEMYRLTGPDGTVHFTNAPTDPQYRRLGIGSGTAAGFLRLPQAENGTGPYGQEIREAADRYGLPVKLVSAVIRAESGFNPRAISRKGAQGLMQLMPATASMLGVRNSFDPRQNIEGGVRHLRGLIDRFPDSLPLALAAYNAGERAVLQYGGIPPYPETQEYVTRVLHFYGGPVQGGSTPPTRIYQLVAPDGTMTYTNIPPRGRR
jgi:soluble lytic murein transglycosylase-like protein